MQAKDLTASFTRLRQQFSQVRQQSLTLCQDLEPEDFNLQAMASTSPLKWHLAHTSWFFETFILKLYADNYQAFDPAYEYLFNSYYNGVGAQFPRAQRGLLSRPSLSSVFAYRQHIDRAISQLLDDIASNTSSAEEIATRLELGLQHEQQHQELMLTDLKYCFAQNPLNPVYSTQPLPSQARAEKLQFIDFKPALIEVGAQADGFCFDNELPRHKVYLSPFSFATRLVSNGEYLDFILAQGYQKPEFWLADAWALVQTQAWQHPLYWRQIDGQWYEFSLHGLIPLDLNRPLAFISAYEADAYARWAGARLASEFEWEYVCQQQKPHSGQFVESGIYQPVAGEAEASQAIQQLIGSAWQWTQSAYSPYPGFKPAKGAIGEYNGKFMCNQLVLKGGSCFTPRSHFRASYRNFFYPQDRWQNTGIRLVKDLI